VQVGSEWSWREECSGGADAIAKPSVTTQSVTSSAQAPLQACRLTLHPPCTLHPAPYIYTLHPTPQTPHPKPQPQNLHSADLQTLHVRPPGQAAAG
jgi:hypothetical protein